MGLDRRVYGIRPEKWEMFHFNISYKILNKFPICEAIGFLNEGKVHAIHHSMNYGMATSESYLVSHVNDDKMKIK